MWASFSCPRIWTRLWWIWGCFPTLAPCSTRRTASWMSLTGTWSDAPGRSEAAELRGRGPACPHGRGSGTAAAAAQHLPLQTTPAPPVRGPEGQPGPAAAGQARGGAEGSPGKFIKRLKWIMTRLMDQVLERNCTLKCRDENKDKRTRRRVVIRPCQL